jgi:putative peptide zinc metalloprotease protein
LAAYGLMAVVGTYLFLVLGILAWRSRLGGFVHAHLRPPFDTVVVVAAIALLTFPVWYRYARRVATLARRRQVSTVELSTVETGAVAS